MQKWEYLTVQLEEGKIRYANGRELPNWKRGPYYYDVLNQYGDQGWE